MNRPTAPGRKSPWRANKGWIVPTLLGMVTVVAGGLIYRVTHPGIPAETVQEAKAESVDPAELNAVHKIQSALFRKRSVSSADWGRLKAYANGDNLEFKWDVTRDLGCAKGTPYEAEAHAIAIRLVTNSDPGTRGCALVALRGFNDPLWRSVATRFLQDPDKNLRNLGQSALRHPVPDK